MPFKNEQSREAVTSEGALAPAVPENHREQSQSLLVRIFIGPQGLRPGWSVLLFVAIFILVGIPLRLALAGLPHPIPHVDTSPIMLIVPEASILIAIAVATLVMARIEGRPLLYYGFLGKRRISRFAWGLLTGVAVLSGYAVVLKFAGLLVFDGQVLHGFAIWKYAAAWAVAFLLVALAEESLLRGYIQYTLARGIGFWWAALLLSASFGLLHLGNPGESPVGVFSAAGVGLVTCLSLWLTKSLWWAVGMHAGWDWAQSYLFGVADSGIVSVGHFYATHPAGSLLWSGGATGPEGSLCIVPLLLLLAAGVWLIMRPKSELSSDPVRNAA